MTPHMGDYSPLQRTFRRWWENVGLYLIGYNCEPKVLSYTLWGTVHNTIVSLYDIQIYRGYPRLFTYHLTNDYITPCNSMSCSLAGDLLRWGNYSNVDYRNGGYDK
jgi:hypothetical protein